MAGIPKILIGAALLLAAFAVSAAPMRLDFEGLRDGERIDGYYDGERGGSGTGPGATLGVRFANGLAVIDADAGGSGAFGGEPSPSTVGAPEDFTILLNVPGGFSGGLALHYSNPGGTLNVRVFPTLDASDPWLADLYFGATPSGGAPDPTGAFGPFSAAGATFAGTARSVLIFSRGPGGFYIDDLVLGSADPRATPVPIPSTALLLAAGLVVLAAGTRQR